MIRLLRLLAFSLAGFACNAGAQADLNLQNLLTGLTQGTEVTLLTPTGNGFVQATSFTPPKRLTLPEAEAVVERTRQQLSSRGITQPTGEQLATALVSGTTMPLRSRIIFSSALPQLISQQGPRTATAQDMLFARQQLGALGIGNPSPDQMRAALSGGVISLPDGEPFTLQGVMGTPGAAAGGSAPAPIVTPPPPPGVRPTVPAR